MSRDWGLKEKNTLFDSLVVYIFGSKLGNLQSFCSSPTNKFLNNRFECLDILLLLLVVPSKYFLKTRA